MIVLIVLLTLLFIRVIVPLVPPKRRKEVREIISDLEYLKQDPEYAAAAEINIRFFKAARFLFTFIHWLAFVAPELRKDRGSLLEMGDLPIEKWQKRNYEGLTKIEVHRCGGIMFTGFVKELFNVMRKVRATKRTDEAIVMLDLGFGGGELGRRVLKKLSGIPLVYIGIDLTPANIELAKRWFKPLHDRGEIIFKELPVVSDEAIDALRREARDSKKVVGVWFGDVFELDKHISDGKVDIICHSRVMHHINLVDRPRLEKMCQKLSPITVEMDDRYSFSFISWIMLGIWSIYQNVALMNSSVLSYLRDPAKEELTGYFKLVPPFSYVRLIFGHGTCYQNKEWEATRKALVEGFSLH